MATHLEAWEYTVAARIFNKKTEGKIQDPNPTGKINHQKMMFKETKHRRNTVKHKYSY